MGSVQFQVYDNYGNLCEKVPNVKLKMGDLFYALKISGYTTLYIMGVSFYHANRFPIT